MPMELVLEIECLDMNLVTQWDYSTIQVIEIQLYMNHIIM